MLRLRFRLACGLAGRTVRASGLSIEWRRGGVTVGSESHGASKGMAWARSDHVAASSIRQDAGLLSASGIQYFRRTKTESGAAVKSVIQLERTGCGIAAMAALADVSYRKMQRVANRLGIFADDSKRALRRHVRTDFSRMKPKWFIPVNLI
jgi:hypothetical protein